LGKYHVRKKRKIFVSPGYIFSHTPSVLGVNYFVDNPGTMWYGEGDDMWMIDGGALAGSEPHKAFPALPVRDKRRNMPAITPANIHVWRDAWRKSKGGSPLWGYEK
jgi:hypothetical protein